MRTFQASVGLPFVTVFSVGGAFLHPGWVSPLSSQKTRRAVLREPGSAEYYGKIYVDDETPNLLWRSTRKELERLQREASPEFDRIQREASSSKTVVEEKPGISGNVVVNGEQLSSVSSVSTDLVKNRNISLSSLDDGDVICRVVALADGKLPVSRAVLPKQLFQPPHLLRRLDDIYHAVAHDETRMLRYMNSGLRPEEAAVPGGSDSEADAASCYDCKEEKKLVATVRTSLEDAGFRLLSRRDLDLCEGLNAGYLLRLSIIPDVSELDPSIGKEFYPEYFDSQTGQLTNEAKSAEKLLFDGRVLVFWRGYSQEVTKGRLLLPKFDYLQASLVQRLSGSVKKRLDMLERRFSISSVTGYRKCTACFLHYMRRLIDKIPNPALKKRFRTMLRSPTSYSPYALVNNGNVPTLAQVMANADGDGTIFKLARYGGSKTRFVASPNPTDSLNPFLICEDASVKECDLSEAIPCEEQRLRDVDRDMYELLNQDGMRCPYDAATRVNGRADKRQTPPMQLLKRVTISNLVDIFTREGRRNLINTLFSKSELVEPTYEEVCVVWRPLPKEELESKQQRRFRPTPPKFLYDLADMYDIDGLPKLPRKEPKPPPSPLEIRTFEGVEMANLPAVLPKTKLVFRPADAFVFDLVSIASFLLIAGSLKFDSPKLDLIALVSISLWIIRTVFRYSNKLARYDLLVKKFLTSKISHRNSGALKYLVTEAGSQRATRAALVHSWLTSRLRRSEETLLDRNEVVLTGQEKVNELIEDLKETPVDIDAALNDLEDLELVRSNDDGTLDVVHSKDSVVRTLKRKWEWLFDGKLSLNALIGRRKRNAAKEGV